MFECTCPLCQEGKYKGEDYYVDMSFLKKVRPVGVSGLLRVKNDAEFLSDCIESCIDALDELIICYQDVRIMHRRLSGKNSGSIRIKSTFFIMLLRSSVMG